MKNKSIFKSGELSAVLWTFRKEFAVVGIFSMIINLLALAPTLYMLQVYDRVLVSHNELTLVFLSLLTLFIFGVAAFAEWSRSRLLVRAGVLFDARLSTRIFNASFESYLAKAGANPTRAFVDLLNIRQFLTGQGIFAFFDAPWTPIYMAVLFFLHPMLGLLGVLFALVQAALAWFGQRRTNAPMEKASQASAAAQMFLNGKLRNSETLESMGMIGNLRRIWYGRHKHALEVSAKSSGLIHRITAVSKFIRYSQQSFALAAGALLVIHGDLSPGAMIAANVLMGKALAPIDQIVSSWRAMVSARMAFQRLDVLLESFPERDAALSRVAPTGAIALKGVSAFAAGRESPILKNINAEIPAGGVVIGVLGPSGSGKSTLARVIVGIWSDVKGDVLFDSVPVHKWDRTELGAHLGYLPQDVELFDGSIAENIARFNVIDAEKVIAAARSAGLHEMILRFPKGYDTPIGEAGSLLSGGQRQRIGLARAVYGDPAVVVLDEPNANLDDAGEQALLSSILELKAKGKTVFLITHRSGAIAATDFLMVLNNGEVVASGPRNDVLQAIQASAEKRRNQGGAQASPGNVLPA